VMARMPVIALTRPAVPNATGLSESIPNRNRTELLNVA
jgi:hypothetical protein